MGLIELFSEGFTRVTETTEGFVDGEGFMGALILSGSSEEDSKLTRKYLLTVSPEVELGYGEIIRRDSDDSTFRITGESKGSSPEMATFAFRQFSAEDYSLVTSTLASIVITDGSSTVTLPAGSEFSISRTRIGSTATAADGTTVLDVIGNKIMLAISSLKLTEAKLSALISKIEGSPFLSVTYPDISGTVTADFLFEIPKITALEFDDEGVSDWREISLTATGKEVSG
ncbi:MAG: hypothetical protein LIO72_06690 [Ruminococcus sp.]|nr:hypothetical protein [Ruminococcus sp.]